MLSGDQDGFVMLSWGTQGGPAFLGKSQLGICRLLMLVEKTKDTLMAAGLQLC